jgi:hypothetical protein
VGVEKIIYRLDLFPIFSEESIGRIAVAYVVEEAKRVVVLHVAA